MRGGSDVQTCCVLAFVDDPLDFLSYLDLGMSHGSLSTQILTTHLGRMCPATATYNFSSVVHRRVTPANTSRLLSGVSPLRCPALTRPAFVICIGEWVQRFGSHPGMAVACPGPLSVVKDIRDYLPIRCVMLVP